jgi:putative membrane protein
MAIMTSPEQPDLRFVLANERTLLAWIRTALALQAGGLGVLQFITGLGPRRVVGIALLILGAGTGLAGYRRYRAADRALRTGAPPPAGRALDVVALSVVAVAVVLAVVYVVTG